MHKITYLRIASTNAKNELKRGFKLCNFTHVLSVCFLIKNLILFPNLIQSGRMFTF